MASRIMIVGGGFVGLRVARLLTKRLRGIADLTLIDREDRFVFSPWLIDALAGELELDQYSEPYTHAAERNGFTFVKGQVMGVQNTKKTIDLTTDTGPQVLPYDLLVICPGARTAYYGIPGAESSTLAIKKLEDIPRLHGAIRDLILKARTATHEERKALLHFMVVGGGPSGIEALFALKSFIETQACTDAPALISDIRYSIIEGSPMLLNGFRPSISEGARRALDRQRVNVRTELRATGLEPGRLLADHEAIEAGLILWCAGVQPNDLPFTPDVSRDQKRALLVDDKLQLDPNIFGAGDAVLCIGKNGKPAPRTAQIAMLEAEILAANVIRRLKGMPLKECQPVIKGSLITLGDTGYIDTPWFAIRTPLTIPLRRLFYRFRFRQMTGR